MNKIVTSNTFLTMCSIVIYPSNVFHSLHLEVPLLSNLAKIYNMPLSYFKSGYIGNLVVICRFYSHFLGNLIPTNFPWEENHANMEVISFLGREGEGERGNGIDYSIS